MQIFLREQTWLFSYKVRLQLNYLDFILLKLTLIEQWIKMKIPLQCIFSFSNTNKGKY